MTLPIDSQNQKGRGRKLYYLLSRLSPLELLELREWLASPLHGGSQQFSDMLAIVLERMGQDPPEELQAGDFAQLLMPGRPLERKKEQYIWVRLTQLYHEALSYLSWLRMRRSTSLQKVMLMEEVCQRGWERMIHETYEAGLKGLAAVHGIKHIQKSLAIEVQYSHHLAATGAGKGNKHLAEIHQSLDHLFLLQKLKYACAGVIEGDPSADPAQNHLLGWALTHLDTTQAALPNVIHAYHAAFRLLRGAIAGDQYDPETLAILEAIFMDPVGFDSVEAMDLFVHAQNYCVLQYRQGEATAMTVLERLYNAILASGVAAEGGLLQPLFYKNVVELMCRLGRLEWVATFVEQYRTRLADDPQGLTHLYCSAVLNFYNGAYKAVVKLLYNEVAKLQSLDMGMSARLYLCQALWETMEWDWLRMSLTAYGQYLRRHEELDPRRKKRSLKFVGYMLRGCDAQQSSHPKRMRKLKELQTDIEASEPEGTYVWFRQKLVEALS